MVAKHLSKHFATSLNSIDMYCYVIQSHSAGLGFPISSPRWPDANAFSYINSPFIIVGGTAQYDQTSQSQGLLQTTGSIAEKINLHSPVQEANPVLLHDFILADIPRQELAKVFQTFTRLNKSEKLSKIFGISGRTLQRQRVGREKNLSAYQADQLISFLKTMSLATYVLGSQDQAETWLQQKAMALNYQEPIDLMTTRMGIQAVNTLLDQIDGGVYL